MHSAFDLIIFDCDGTLVDTEYLHNKVVSDHLAVLGYPQFTVEYNLIHFAGKGMETCAAMIEKVIGEILPANFVENYVADVTRRMPELLRNIDGVHEVIEHCQGRMKICVGSNGERANVLRSLEIGGFAEFFPLENVFTKNQVKHGKPAPDLFLLAAERMGATPKRTVVIEDSVTGAAAGVAAGMTVIGFVGTFHDQAAQEKALRAVGAHYVTASFHEIVELIERMAT